MCNLVIEASELTRTYKSQTAVDRVNLEVPEGSIFGFLGPNGAGKTTTIRMLLGLIRPTSGNIKMFGLDFPAHRIDVLKRVGSLVENPSYYGHLNGFENLAVFARLLGVSDVRIHEVLDVVRLTPAAKRAVKGYSLGMKQRLGIAMALLGSPQLLILDEPTNGLDPTGILEIRELIKEMPKQHGITVLVSSHLLSEIDQMATTVGIINHGKLLFQDTIDQLRRQSQSHLILDVENPQAAVQFLHHHGYEVTLQEEKSIVLNDLSYAVAADVNRKLVHENFAVYRIREHVPSLEDIFLRFVGTGGSL